MNLLPLDDFRRILGYNVWHWWGLADTTLVPVTSACNDILHQYNWQAADNVGREAITEAIETAESKLREQLGFPVAPQYIKATIQWPHFYDRSQVRLANVDPTGKYISVQAPDGHIQALGYEQLTLIGNAALAFTDDDGDGLKENWSLSIATSVLDPDKIAVYFTSADRLDSEEVGPRWRIQPVRVTISAGTATVRGKRWTVVQPVRYEGVDVIAIDPTVDANFAATLDVYNRTTNPDGETIYNAQSTLIWETNPCHGWWCSCGCQNTTTPASSIQDPASVAVAISRCGIRDSLSGILTPAQAVRDATTGIWSGISWDMCREPDRVEVRYLAGYPLEHSREVTGDQYPLASGAMARKYQTIVARLAAAELAGRPCACDTANKELYRWQFDLARSSGANDEAYGAVSAADLDNPLGTRRGQVAAWKAVKSNFNLIGTIAQ